MELDLATINLSYHTESAHYKKGEHLEKSKLVFSGNKGNVPLSLDVPFRVISQTDKGCVFGHDRHHVDAVPANARHDTDWPHDLYEKKQTSSREQKKRGVHNNNAHQTCAVVPEYEIPVEQRSSLRKWTAASKDALSKLGVMLKESPAMVVTLDRFYIAVMGKDEHKNHEFGAPASHAHLVDTRVTERISTLVREGITSVREVRACLRYFVDDVLFPGVEKLPPSSRTFYPTKKDITNHVQAALHKDRFSAVDQQNTIHFVDTIRNANPQ